MPGNASHKQDVLQRLRRVQGQIRGLERLIEEDTYCIDVLTQIAAATAALKSCAIALLGEHLRGCVYEAIDAGWKDADVKVAEATRAMARFMRS